MEYPYECAEQSFSRYYANTLASFISNASPKIKQVFDRWKITDIAPSPSERAGGEVLMSNLQKNEELKSVLLQETPWVMDANIEVVSTKITSIAETAPAIAEKPAKAKAAKKPAAKKPAKPVIAPAGDLLMVETKSTAKPTTAATEPTKAKAPRKAPNWKKDAEAKAADAPLVMVETQK